MFSLAMSVAIFWSTSFFLQHLCTDGAKNYIEYFNNSYTSRKSQNTITVCLRLEKTAGDSPSSLIKVGPLKLCVCVCVCCHVKCSYFLRASNTHQYGYLSACPLSTILSGGKRVQLDDNNAVLMPWPPILKEDANNQLPLSLKYIHRLRAET